jgi:hypothetical protein
MLLRPPVVGNAAIFSVLVPVPIATEMPVVLLYVVLGALEERVSFL